MLQQHLCRFSTNLTVPAGDPLSCRRPNSAGTGAQATIKQPVRPGDQPGALLAASVLWQRTSEACMRPSIRQCLTFEEIGQAGP